MNNITLPKVVISELSPIKLGYFVRDLHVNKLVQVSNQKVYWIVYINLLKAVLVYLINKPITFENNLRKSVLFKNNIQYIQDVINDSIRKYSLLK